MELPLSFGLVTCTIVEQAIYPCISGDNRKGLACGIYGEAEPAFELTLSSHIAVFGCSGIVSTAL